MLTDMVFWVRKDEGPQWQVQVYEKTPHHLIVNSFVSVVGEEVEDKSFTELLSNESSETERWEVGLKELPKECCGCYFLFSEPREEGMSL